MVKNRIFYMDYVRALAIIGVLVIHTAAPYATMYNKVDFWIWESSIIYNSLVRWCVPLFLMVSGALLLGRKEESLTDFFTKRANRIIIPFLCWSVFYFAWRHFYFGAELSIAKMFSQMLNNGTYYHLWYFTALIGIYLLVPIFNVFVNHASRTLVGYLVLLWVMVYGGFRYYSFIVPNDIETFFPLTEFIGMFLMGYYFSKFEQPLKARIVIYLLGIIGGVGTILRTNSFAFDQGVFSSYAFSYSSPGVIAMSIALFVFIKYAITRWSNNKENFQTGKIIKLISTASFGIYLVHPVLLDLLRPYFHEGLDIYIHPIIGIPLQTIILLVVSTIISWGIGKIPVLKKTI